MVDFEAEAREVAREFPTPNVRRAIALAEAGQLTWRQVHDLLREALAEGLAAVR